MKLHSQSEANRGVSRGVETGRRGSNTPSWRQKSAKILKKKKNEKRGKMEPTRSKMAPRWVKKWFRRG